MGFWDSLGRSVKSAAGMDNSGVEDAMKAAKAQAALAETQRQEIQAKEDAEKKKLNDKQMRSMKRKYTGSGLMGGSDATKEKLGE